MIRQSSIDLPASPAASAYAASGETTASGHASPAGRTLDRNHVGFRRPHGVIQGMGENDRGEMVPRR